MSYKKYTRKKEAAQYPTAAVFNLLMALDIPATYDYVDKTLKEHPDFPSLLSLAETLPNWGVKTEGVKGGVSDLSEIDFPSIVHLSDKRRGMDYAVLENVQNGHVSIFHPAVGRETLRLDDFGDIWSGVLLRAFPAGKTGEPDYAAHRKRQHLNRIHKFLTIGGLPALFMLAFGYGVTQAGSLGTMIPLGLAKAAGFALCVVMVAAGLGHSNLMSSLCPTGKVVNCARVMRSPAGRLFGVSMAEWGLLYFGGGLLSLLASFFFGQFQNDIFLLTVLGLLALPYTIFSVIYQAFVVRSWCWMCLAIMGLFWVEFYLLHDALISRLASGSLKIAFPFSLFLGFGAAALVWISVKRVISTARRADSLESHSIRIRRQPEYIQFKLSQAEKSDMGKVPFGVEIGPSNAKLVITAVVNPLCGHCWRAFDQLSHLIDMGRGNIKGDFRFLVTPDKEDETPTEAEEFIDREVSLRILSLAQNGNRERVYQALADWFRPDEAFSKGKYRRWQRKYIFDDDVTKPKAAEILNLHRSWAMNNKIVGTPALFFNDRRLPPGMQLDDLKIFLMRQLNT